jgi:hypothetical protein
VARFASKLLLLLLLLLLLAEEDEDGEALPPSIKGIILEYRAKKEAKFGTPRIGVDQKEYALAAVGSCGVVCTFHLMLGGVEGCLRTWNP